MNDTSSLNLAEQYDRDGFVFPLDVFNQTAVDDMRAELASVEKQPDADLPLKVSQLLRTNCHFVLPFVTKAACSANLLDKVEEVLGPDILIYSAEFFIKEPQTEKIVTWHQDLTYWGLGETDDELTAWIALSDVTVESGCMRFVPGSHKQRIVPHQDTFDENNLLSRGQEVAVDVDENEAVNIELKPGQVSFHHGRMFHASGPNKSNHRRIGLVIRYVTPHVRQSGAGGYAIVARGEDKTGNWNHMPRPIANFDAKDLEAYQRIRDEHVKVLMKNAEGTSTVYG
ncbi:MAG: phytanoyl-CoA dioxygenase family protein [Pseudomonadota bacterium]